MSFSYLRNHVFLSRNRICTSVVILITAVACASAITAIVVNEKTKNQFSQVRNLYTVTSHITPGSPDFWDQVFNSKNENYPHKLFMREGSIEQKIKVPTSSAGMANLDRLINETRQLFQSGKEPTPEEILNVFVSFHINNNLKPKPRHDLLDRIPSSEHTIETNLYFFANNKSACGDASIALSALLRASGLKTRTILVSNTTSKLEASHVLIDYFSKTRKKWIMIDVVSGLIPKLNNTYLSSFEYFYYFNKFKNTKSFMTKIPALKIFPFYFEGGQIGYIKKSYLSELISMKI